MFLSTDNIGSVLFQVTTTTSDYRGEQKLTKHVNVTVFNDPAYFEFDLPKELKVIALLTDGVLEGDKLFIYTSPRVMDKQGNDITWVLPATEDSPVLATIKRNENSTFTLTVDRERL